MTGDEWMVALNTANRSPFLARYAAPATAAFGRRGTLKDDRLP
jgi:hypothetical protein